MKKKFGYKNALAVPKIQKVVVSVATGSIKDDKKKKVIEKSLALITGQKPKLCPAKKSIASFKVRKGMPIGYAITLRGRRMHEFLDRLINIALPRTRDFKGLNPKSIDGMGNFNMGVREHIVFPETEGEELSKVFGLEITVVTSAKTQEEALELLKLLGFPFSSKK
jgi:large subunit ribosomal protein L5